MMRATCLTQDQIRDRACRIHLGLGRKQRRPSSSTLVKVGVVAFSVFWFLTAQAAEQASWYGEQHRGQLMADGRPFDPDKLTAASWSFDLGTKVLVTHEDRSVVVEITDRGPAKRLCRQGRTIDLSRAAFERLADPDLGLIDVTTRKR